MLFALICSDKPGALALRKSTRPAHVEYLKTLGDRLAFAGPFTDASGNPNGSLVVYEAESMEEAELTAAQDPYAQAGLFDSVDIRRWNWAINAPEGA